MWNIGVEFRLLAQVLDLPYYCWDPTQFMWLLCRMDKPPISPDFFQD